MPVELLTKVSDWLCLPETEWLSGTVAWLSEIKVSERNFQSFDFSLSFGSDPSRRDAWLRHSGLS